MSLPNNELYIRKHARKKSAFILYALHKFIEPPNAQ
jgi:hypothetical protein